MKYLITTLALIALTLTAQAQRSTSTSANRTTVSNTTYMSSPDSIVRPATYITYADGQAVGSRILVFKGIAANVGQSVMFSDATVEMDSAGLPVFDLLLLKDTVGVTVPVDGVAYSFPVAQKLKVIGNVTLTATRTYSSLTLGTATGLFLTCTPTNAAGDIYGILTAASAWNGPLSGKIVIMPRFIQ